MATVTFEKTLEWKHKKQLPTFVGETANATADIPVTRATSGPVYDALMKLRAVLKDPEKHPEVTIVYAENS